MIWGKFLNKEMVKTTANIHIRTFASYSPNKKSLFVYLVNKSANEILVDPQVVNYQIKGLKQEWELTSTGPDDVNPVWQQIKDMKLGATVTVKGTSIKVIEYQLK